MAEQLKRPDLKGAKSEIVVYISYLEKVIEGYRNNGAVMFVAALNRQLKKLADQIDEADINFSSSEDKLYERFLNTAKLGKDLISDFKSFLQEYGDKVQEDEKSKIPVVEQFARRE